MIRTSSYTIYVDLPDNNEDMLLVHGYTGAYDKVARRVATYVRSLETKRAPKPLFGNWSPEPSINGEIPLPSTQTIETLKRRGYLTEMTPEEEEAFFSQYAVLQHASQSRQVGYVFMPTYNCNLRCSYCFQDHMRANPAFSHLLRTMRRELVDRIFAAMPKIEAQHTVREGTPPPRNMGFFGGEPLLERSKPIVEYIIKKGQAVGQSNFWAVSNATDLHFYQDLLGPDKLAFVQVTLDGPANEHDQRRIYADGSGSFERIAQNITMALELGVRIAVRMNIDRNNIQQLPLLANQIVARGWDRYQTFGAYTAPIHASNDKTEMKTTLSSWELDQQLNALRTQYPEMRVIGRPDDKTKDQARQIFNKHNPPSLRSTFCSAHTGMYIFDAFGDAYACWERTGDPNIRIGHVTKEGDFAVEEKTNKLWRSRNVTTNAICRKCRYAMYCGGGCAALAENHRGEFFTNFCDGFAARFRASVAEAYVEHMIDLEPIQVADRTCDL